MGVWVIIKLAIILLAAFAFGLSSEMLRGLLKIEIRGSKPNRIVYDIYLLTCGGLIPLFLEVLDGLD